MIVAALFGLLSLMAVSSSWARADRPKDQSKPDDKSRLTDVDKFIKQYDKNNDGFLSKEELTQAATDCDSGVTVNDK